MSSVWTIRRSATDVKLSGLCAGIAQHWGVDPVVVRVGVALLALSGGLGVVLYLAGWLLVPRTGRNDPPIYDVLGERARSWPRELWIAIIAAACILAVTTFGTMKGVAPALILALIWYFGYYKARSTRPGATAPAVAPAQLRADQLHSDQTGTPRGPEFISYPGPPTPFTEAAEAWRQRVEQAHVGPANATYRGIYDTRPAEDLREPNGPAATLPPAHPLGAESVAYQTYLGHPDPIGLYGPHSASRSGSVSLTPKASRAGSPPARRLRLVSLVVVGLTLAGLGVADAAGVAVSTQVYLAATLLVLGLTLVAAAWFGRARGILPVAMLVLVATLGSSATGLVTQHAGWGTQERAYTTSAQLLAGDEHQLGRLRVDLSRLSTRTDESYTARVDTGSLEVVAPQSMNVVVNWQVGMGAFSVDGHEVEGSDLRDVRRLSPADPLKKTLVLNLSVRQGVVQVVRR